MIIISKDGLRSATFTTSVRNTLPPAQARTTIESNEIRSTGHVFMFLDHSVMQSKQNMCSQFWGIPTSWFKNFIRQMEHFSELPSELSEQNPDTCFAALLEGDLEAVEAHGAMEAAGSSEWSVTQPDESLSPSESRRPGSARRRRRAPIAQLPLLLSLASPSSLNTYDKRPQNDSSSLNFLQ